MPQYLFVVLTNICSENAESYLLDCVKALSNILKTAYIVQLLFIRKTLLRFYRFSLVLNLQLFILVISRWIDFMLKI